MELAKKNFWVPDGASSDDDGIKNQIHVPEKKGALRKMLAFLGPGFLVCIAYIDPGNFESDLQSGAQYKFELLWVVLFGSIAGCLIQSLSANLGVVTGKHLAEHCRSEYPKVVRYILWLLTEVVVIAADIPEVIGTATAFHLLFRIPLWIGVLLTGLSTLLLLGLQKYGVRKLEFVVAVLVFTMVICFFLELGYANPSPKDVLGGFIPKLNGSGATGIAISLVGALVMPHNLFLHSALVLTRKVPRTDRAVKEARTYCLLESGFAIFLSFLINVCVISVSATICFKPTISAADQDRCNDLNINSASFLLRDVLGRGSKIVFAIALLASGESSTITGTYAGQYVMQGFLNLRLKPWVRNMITRCIAIVPSLAVALVGGSHGSGNLIIICSMTLGFMLPFSLIPLLKFTGSRVKMGKYANNWPITIIVFIISGAMMIVNVYYLVSAYLGWLLHTHFLMAGRVLLSILVFSVALLYLVGIGYLVFRPNTDAERLMDFETKDVEGDSGVAEEKVLHRKDILEMQLPGDVLAEITLSS